MDIAEFNEACGVGVVVTREQIQEQVEAAIKDCQEELLERRYRFNLGKLMSKLSQPGTQWLQLTVTPFRVVHVPVCSLSK